MTITKAVQRLQWRLQNTWKPNDTDVEAINDIVSFVNEKHKAQLSEHKLMAKMYIFIYREFLEYYKATVFDAKPQADLHRILEMPLEQHLELFTDTLNQSEMYYKMESKGIDVKHPALKTKSELEKDSSIFTKEMMSPTWTVENVTENMVTQINHAINKYA